MAKRVSANNALMILLVFVPITLFLEYVVHASPTLLFLTSALGIVPLAGLMGKSTEMLAEQVGDGLGGLLNATFGNAAEMIIAIFALRAGLHDLVKASLIGSIIGNILLVFGLSVLLGGLKYQRQVFDRTVANLGATMLLLSGIALVVPTAFHLVQGTTDGKSFAERSLSLEISVVLIVCYILSLVFALRTHGHLYQQAENTVTVTTTGESESHKVWSKRRSCGLLLAAAALVGWMSEIFVSGAEEAAHSLGMNEVFVGVIIVAVVGNAAEHSTAVLVALKNKMDLALQIAVGSSLQIALLVAPVLVFLSYIIGPRPLTLVFSTLEVVSVVISGLVVGRILDDGETHWMEGVLLLAVYLILGFAFFNLP